MGKFNRLTKKSGGAILADQMVTRNFEGGIAFKMETKVRLFTRVLTSLFNEHKFYQDSLEHDVEILKDLTQTAETDPEFILQLAAFARNYMHLRSIPVVLLAEASLIKETAPFVRKYAPHVLRRADELLEVVAYVKNKYFEGGRCIIPACLKKGIEDAFENFDEYQFLKYDPRKGLKFRDIIKLAHPKPADKKREALYGLLVGEREPDKELTPIAWALKELAEKEEFDEEAIELARMAHATHELVIKKYGSSPETWKAVLPTMGYMAKLRNLKAMADVLGKLTIKEVAKDVANPDLVLNSKQLPFRFYSAYKSLQDNFNPYDSENYEILMEAATQALEVSVKNLPSIPGKTLVAVDVSGSMETPISRYSTVTAKDVALMLGAIAGKVFDKAVTYLFGEDIKALTLLKNTAVMNNFERLKSIDVGHATYANKVIMDAVKRKTDYERIILLSDMQCYAEGNRIRGRDSFAGALYEYWNKVNADTKVYSVDLVGYGTSKVNPKNPKVFLMAGWSEKIFRLIDLQEKEPGQMIDFIEKWAEERLNSLT